MDYCLLILNYLYPIIDCSNQPHWWIRHTSSFLLSDWNVFGSSQLEEGSRTEHLQAQKCRARINHLESADAENLAEWNNTRVKRILVDYMLRMSYYETAEKLAESSNIQVILHACSFCKLLVCRFFLGWICDISNLLLLETENSHHIIINTNQSYWGLIYFPA